MSGMAFNKRGSTTAAAAVLAASRAAKSRSQPRNAAEQQLPSRGSNRGSRTPPRRAGPPDDPGLSLLADQHMPGEVSRSASPERKPKRFDLNDEGWWRRMDELLTSHEDKAYERLEAFMEKQSKAIQQRTDHLAGTSPSSSQVLLQLANCLSPGTPPPPGQEAHAADQQDATGKADGDLAARSTIIRKKSVSYAPGEAVECTAPGDKKARRGAVGPVVIMDDAAYERLAEEKSKERSARASVVEEADVVPGTFKMGKDLKDFIESNNFDLFFGVAIMTNVLVIGAQIEVQSWDVRSTDLPVPFFVINQAYAMLFFAELCLRVLCAGRVFFYITDRSKAFWNYLDFAIVGSSIFELVLGIVLSISGEKRDSQEGPGGTVLRVLRVMRVLRVLRVIKVVKFVRALSELVSSIFSTLRSLMWSLALLVMIIYMFGILFSDQVIGYLAAFPPREELLEGSTEAALYTYFGSLHISMHTLFRCITGGHDWGDVSDTLIHIDWALGYLFNVYLSFCYFAVLNVMTAVFCQRAIESAEQDQDNMLQKMLAERAKHRKLAQSLFLVFDSCRDETITLMEFEQVYSDEKVQAMFQTLDLNASDAWTLFKLLDHEGNGDINVEEFIAGCMRLRGPAKAMDIACVMDENRRITNTISSLKAHTNELENLMLLMASVLAEDAQQASQAKEQAKPSLPAGDSIRPTAPPAALAASPTAPSSVPAVLPGFHGPQGGDNPPAARAVSMHTSLREAARSSLATREFAFRSNRGTIDCPGDLYQDITFDVGPVIHPPSRLHP